MRELVAQWYAWLGGLNGALANPLGDLADGIGLRKDSSMDVLLPLLPVLACLIGMSAMMWLMMRGQHAAPATDLTLASAPRSTRRLSLGGLCLDRRVVVGLAAGALGVWLLVPSLLLPALLLAAALACPLSMLLMLPMMRRSGPAEAGRPAVADVPPA